MFDKMGFLFAQNDNILSVATAVVWNAIVWGIWAAAVTVGVNIANSSF